MEEREGEGECRTSFRTISGTSFHSPLLLNHLATYVISSFEALLGYGLKIDSWLDLETVTSHASTSIVVSQFYRRDLLTYIIEPVLDSI